MSDSITNASRVAALIFLTACGGGRTHVQTPPQAPREVTLVTATLTEIADTVTVYGSLAADETVDLAFKHAGPLGKLDVDIGTALRAGETLAALDATTLDLAVRETEAAVRQARARLGLPVDGDDDTVDPEATAFVRQARAVLVEAKLTRARAEELVRGDLAPPATLDTAAAAYAVAESRLQQALNDVRDYQAVLTQRRVELEIARQAQSESTLVAPFDGVVAARIKAVPEFVGVGEAVVRFLRIDPLRLRLRVPEREATGVALAQRVAFTVDGAPGSFAGEVARIAPAIDPMNRTLLVEVRVQNAERKLKPGLFARASLDVGAPVPRVTVPPAAIVRFAGVEKVFVVEDGVARERLVHSGRTVGELVEIAGGLEAGTAIVAAPQGLADGRPVSVKANG